MEKELILSPGEIASRVKDLGREISRDYAGKSLVTIGVLNGVFIFISDLVRALTIPVKVDFVRLASYGSSSSSSGEISITKDIELPIQDQDVLVVEDIVDSGFTLEFLMDHLVQHQPKSVRICALIDKPERRKVSIPLNYVGFNIPQGFLVGYGLDYAEQYRFLDGIYHLKL
jgi:hypoxanthine phosphoribosyltransferase